MEETVVMSRVTEKWIFGYSRNGLPYLMIFQSTPLWKIIKYRKSFQSESRIDFGYPKIRFSGTRPITREELKAGIVRCNTM